MTEPRIPALAPSDWPAAMREALAVLLPENPRHPRLRTEGRPKALNALTLGMIRAMPRQSRQRWNCARLSLPMIHTNRRLG